MPSERSATTILPVNQVFDSTGKPVIREECLYWLKESGNCVIFDLDGTLADNSHRKHLLPNAEQQGAEREAQWDVWFSKTLDDVPIWPIVHILDMYRRQNIKIVICTARNIKCLEDTIAWFEKHDIFYNYFFCRSLEDRREDRLVKYDMLQIMKQGGLEPFIAYDDRDCVVTMWRENGIRCLQVAPGSF